MYDVGCTRAGDDVGSTVVFNGEFEDLCGFCVNGSACRCRVDDSDLVDDWFSVVVSNGGKASGNVDRDTNVTVLSSSHECGKVISACGSNNVVECPPVRSTESPD